MPNLVPKAAIKTDAQLIQLWCHGKSPHTQRYYQEDANKFLAFVGKPVAQVTLLDVQAFVTALSTSGLTKSSQGRTLSAIKSLLSFGNRIGVLPANVGAPIKPPLVRDTLVERILPETTVLAMIHQEPLPRNRAILKLLYGAGLRVSELCGLVWRDLITHNGVGLVTVCGKGGRTRVIALEPSIWQELMALRTETDRNAPIFRSLTGNKQSQHKGGSLSPSQVTRIVRAAALRVGVTDVNVSPHWLRHSHASHALEHGAPIHLVQATLGHSSLGMTGRYLHVRPGISSARYLRLGATSVDTELQASESHQLPPALPDGEGNYGF
jgi:integrase/recombinase XerD